MSTKQQQLTEKRLEIQEIKKKPGKLGEQSQATKPDNLEQMYAGKMCLNLIKEKVASENLMWSLLREYSGLDKDEVKKLREIKGKAKLQGALQKINCVWLYDKLISLQDEFELAFERFKRRVSKITEDDPLYQKFAPIKGVSPYLFSILMALIKDISKFDTASSLTMYAGCGCIDDPETGEGVAVTKANINRIKQIYAKQGKEYKGFNTDLAGRMHVLTDSLIKQKGFFYEFYAKMRERIEEQRINDGSAVRYKKEEIAEMKKKDPSIKYKEGIYYMKGKKNFSLVAFSDRNARRRLQRTFLHLLWTECRTLKGLPVRKPYPIDYLGHNKFITLDEVIAYEKAN